MKYCIFLRGINVNGIKIKMADLKKCLGEMGFNDVKTIGATGNAVVEADIIDQSAVEAKLSQYFNYDAHVIIKKKADLRVAVNYTREISTDKGLQIYLLLSNDGSLFKELLQLFDSVDKVDNEELLQDRENIFWIVPKGMTLKSEFGSKVLSKKSFKNRMTSRNMNTIGKVFNYMEGD